MRSLLNPDDPTAAQARDRTEQYGMLLAFWFGAVVYGLYVALFLLSVKVAVETRGLHRTFSARVFSFSSFVMFILASVYMGINASRYLYAFSPNWTNASKGQLPVYYLRDYSTFRSFAPLVITSFQVWLGDALAIYRCLIIWGMNWWIILVPGLLLVHSVVSNSIVMIYLMDPTTLEFQQVRPLIDMVYPINITQNCLTTSLIILKIFHQHSVSRAAGLSEHGSGVGLLTIIRIIVESTMIFTVQQVIISVLYYMDSPVQYVFHGTLVSSIGITFVLLSIRVNEARKKSKLNARFPRNSQFSKWLPSTHSNTTANEESQRGVAGVNRRRALSDSFMVTSSGIPASYRFAQSTTPVGSIRHATEDLEKADMLHGKSMPDAILAVKSWSKVCR